LAALAKNKTIVLLINKSFTQSGNINYSGIFYTKMYLLNIIKLTLLLLFISTAAAYSQSNEDCLMCHDDESMTMEKNGKEISIAVSESEFNHTNMEI